jgi:hypothetical protein
LRAIGSPRLSMVAGGMQAAAAYERYYPQIARLAAAGDVLQTERVK